MPNLVKAPNPSGVALGLGLVQIITWGTTFYLPAVIAAQVAEELFLSTSQVFAGFSLGILCMGFFSFALTQAYKYFSQKALLQIGLFTNFIGLLTLSYSHEYFLYCISWIMLGIGMRLTLYDAVFALLLHVNRLTARKLISQITLYGGLSSAIFWPLGVYLTDNFGWRNLVILYAFLQFPAFLLVKFSKLDCLSREMDCFGKDGEIVPEGLDRKVLINSLLFILIFSIFSFINTGLTTHAILLMGLLGVGVAQIAASSSVRGVSQTLIRILELLFLKRQSALRLNILVALLFFLSILVFFIDWKLEVLPYIFFMLSGFAIGLMSITRGSVPIELYSSRKAALVAQLLAPVFISSALAPAVFSMIIETYGGRILLELILLLAMVGVLLSVVHYAINIRR